jgi:hypothetical protein
LELKRGSGGSWVSTPVYGGSLGLIPPEYRAKTGVKAARLSSISPGYRGNL